MLHAHRWDVYSQADSGCSSGPAFACGDAEHLEAKARLDELLPMFE